MKQPPYDYSPEELRKRVLCRACDNPNEEGKELCEQCRAEEAANAALTGGESVPSNALLAVSVAAQRLLDAWDAKTPLAWQPENNRVLLEDLRAALKTANAALTGGVAVPSNGVVGGK